MRKMTFAAPGNKMPLRINQINHTSFAEVINNERFINPE